MLIKCNVINKSNSRNELQFIKNNIAWLIQALPRKVRVCVFQVDEFRLQIINNFEFDNQLGNSLSNGTC
jgi:hypothetical protein